MIFRKTHNYKIYLSKKNKFPNAITLKIDSIIMCIQSNDDEFSEYVNNHYLTFTTQDLPNYTINVHKYKKEFSWEPFEEVDYKYDLINFDEKFFFRQNKNKNEIDLFLPKQYKDWEVDNFFKLYFSSVSVKHNILLLHASAIIRDNKAILFSGPSGTGKSTISKLSGYPVIHDDIIGISYISDNAYCLRTIPFKVNYKKVVFNGELSGFYRIYQSPDTFIQEVDSREKLILLLYSVWSFDKFKGNSSKQEETIMNYCLQLLTKVDIKKLYFSKTKDFLKLI